MKRRQLDLHSAKEVIDEIESLRAGGYQKAGNWNLTQICEHLTGTMKGGMHGFGFRLPWILRATVAKWGFLYTLRTRKMGAGFPTLKKLKPKSPGEEEDQAVIIECMETCLAASTFNGSLENYALADGVTVEDWREFMWIHASHHLGFLIPKDAEQQ